MGSPALTENALRTFSTHYGIRVSDIGEDGNLVALGHHNKRQVLAAFNRHARTAWGTDSLYDGWLASRRKALDDITERWAVLLTKCVEAGQSSHEDDCGTCHEIAESPWWMSLTAKPADPGAFPVTIWEA